MLTPDMKIKLEEYRRKVTDGSVTREELAEAVRIMREGRFSAAATSKASKVKKEQASINSDDLLEDFLK
jgi:hypothetical protein